MTISRTVYALTLLALISACASTKAYSGATLPPAELATIRGSSTMCSGSNYIYKFDGQFEGQDLQAQAGSHRMHVSHVSTPFIGDDPRTSFIPECVQVTGFDVSFVTAAQHTYWFYVDDSIPENAQLSVWQSISEPGPEGTQIPAQVEHLWSHQNCFIDERYARCFGGR